MRSFPSFVILNHNLDETTFELPAGAHYTDLLRGQDATGRLTLAGCDMCILATKWA